MKINSIKNEIKMGLGQMITIVVGIGQNKNVDEAVKILKAENPGFQLISVNSEEEFLEKFLDKKADAYVRGSLSASLVMKHLRENENFNRHKTDLKNGESENQINRASYINLNDHEFLLAPVGIDEGQNNQEKLLIVEQACDFLKNIGKEPKIGVISGGRSQDVGRSPQIDKSIIDGEKLTSIIKHKYSVKHYYILIENAIKDKCNLILAPDGISGNLIFRSLVLVGSGKSHGAVTLGIDQILIDTSRAQSVEGYIRALNFAHYLAKLKM